MSLQIPLCGRAVACVALGFTVAVAQAQTAAPTAVLQPVIITGNPLGSSDIAQPSSTLSGEGLVLRRGSTLGETLDGLPGVSSSYFGPNANRPVIRGQDGDRIRVLSNAGASLDASSLSFDHAVPIDPLVVQRIEVLRGPAALLYGGSAVGGVVNAIDNRIPREPIGRLGGTAELRYGGAAREQGAGAVLEAGTAANGGGRGLALHADAFWRDTDDLRVPVFQRPVDGGTELRKRIVNSASRSDGGALGGSMVWNQGFLGASVDTYRSKYGIAAEEDVTIRMKRDKFALAGELRELSGPIRTVRGQLQRTQYRHEEVEGTGAVGTTFDNEGTDARVELEHAALRLNGGTLRGVFGGQVESSRFSAFGEEAFVPSTSTRQRALFVVEQWAAGPLKLSLGGRLEHVRVASQGDAAGAPQPTFGAPQSRRFVARSASFGAVVDLSPTWQMSSSLAYTERAPTYYELYANGVHIATAAFERGETTAQKERGANLDVAIQWKQGANRVKLGTYASRFSNYIALLRSGEPDFVDDQGEAFPVYVFRGVPARSSGVELEAAWRAIAVPSVDLDAKLDMQRATNRASGEPLPRIAPLRVALGAAVSLREWKLRAEVAHAARQSRVSNDDTPTASHTLVNLLASHRMRLGSAEGLWFVRLHNLGNKLAYNAASVATVRPLAPLPGRSLKVGLQLGF